MSLCLRNCSSEHGLLYDDGSLGLVDDDILWRNSCNFGVNVLARSGQEHTRAVAKIQFDMLVLHGE